MGKNSHHALRVLNENFFVRLYKFSDFEHPLDMELNFDSQFEDEIMHFLIDSATHSLTIGAVEEDA